MTAASNLSIKKKSSPRALAAVSALIFLLAFGVRILSWHDTRLEVGKIQTVVVADYKRVGELLREGGLRSFFSRSSPLADLNNLGHPPGYSMLIALAGSSDTRIQFGQMICDALGAVMIFLIVAELLLPGAGVVAGLLAAFSPQFAWNSVLLLPDSISVLPTLIAVYLIVRAVKKPRLVTFIIAGALIGISCWLRANAMLLTVFAALAVLLLANIEVTRARSIPAKARGWRFALAVVCGTLLVILPLTIRNAIVFHRFIPLSLGAGQTLLEGIADYDREGRFGIPATDMGIMKQESEMYGRPDYYGTLFQPDGVERERARLSRGFAVVRSHPLWFAGVMARRASSMVRLERARLISPQPAVTHAPEAKSDPALILYPVGLVQDANSAAAEISVDWDAPHAGVLTIVGNNSRYGVQAAWPLAVRPDSDYLLETAVKTERGRMRISIVSGARILASSVLDALEQMRPEDQPYVPVRLAFVADNAATQIVVSNEAADVANSSIKIAPLAFYNLGPARFLWMRYPRFVVHGIQKLFLTAVMLPLAIVGFLILIFKKQSRALVILSVVPVYFFTVQSIVHTEYRYVLAVDYFLFAFAGVTVVWIAGAVIAKVRGPRSGFSLR
jgi:hypothetical protein